MTDRLTEIEARLNAAKSAASDQWEVGGLTIHGGYAVVATDALDVSTDEYLPEEAAEMFAHAPADLAALVAAVNAMRDAHAEHRRVLTHGGDRPERTDACHCLGCVMYRAAMTCL